MNITSILALNALFLLVVLVFLIIFASINGREKKHREKTNQDIKKIKEHINSN